VNWDDIIIDAAATDTGMRRSNNQDSHSAVRATNVEMWRQRGHLFMVADGMGAHAVGELASKMACDNIPHYYNKTKAGTPAEAISKAFREVGALIHGRATANRDFARQVTQWTFKETGVLKVGKIQHYLNEPAEDGALQKASDSNPKIYRVKNDVTFNIELSEYDVDRYAPPALASADELQLEFTMLSPYHRLTLQEASKTANSTIYTASFTTPDQHGIFSFRVNYKRPYMTSLEIKEEVTVRHFAHDEFPRSWTITAGWTWIAGIWVTVAGWLAFVAVWLWSEPVRGAATAKKTQ